MRFHVGNTSVLPSYVVRSPLFRFFVSHCLRRLLSTLFRTRGIRRGRTRDGVARKRLQTGRARSPPTGSSFSPLCLVVGLSFFRFLPSASLQPCAPPYVEPTTCACALLSAMSSRRSGRGVIIFPLSRWFLCVSLRHFTSSCELFILFLCPLSHLPVGVSLSRSGCRCLTFSTLSPSINSPFCLPHSLPESQRFTRVCTNMTFTFYHLFFAANVVNDWWSGIRNLLHRTHYHRYILYF